MMRSVTEGLGIALRLNPSGNGGLPVLVSQGTFLRGKTTESYAGRLADVAGLCSNRKGRYGKIHDIGETMENKKKVGGCIVAGCGGAIVMIAIFAVAVTAFVMSVVKSSDAYTMAMERAESNPVVVEALGEPIEAGFMIMGSVQTSGPAGDANI